MRARQGGQGGQGDKGEKQYKVCILSNKNSPLKDHCPYKIFLVFGGLAFTDHIKNLPL